MQYKSFMEALKGKQHKIDKNKNGKIDAHDFKLLRKEEVEEVEQVEEGIQQTLRKYVPGYAKHQLNKKMDAQAYEKGDSIKKTVDKDVNYDRYKKIADKLKKEEVEQIDEISSGLATSYLNKREPQHKPNMNAPETSNRDAKVAKGIRGAVSRMHGYGPDKNAENKVTGRMAYRKSVGATHTFNKEETELTEATVKTQKYSWGTMKTVHHGADFSIPLHPEHHQAISKLKDNQEHKFKDETGRHWTAKRMGDDVHFQGANNGGATKVKHSDLKEETDQEERMSRSDYKVGPSGRKSHKEIVFKHGEEDKKASIQEVAPPGFEGTVKAMKKHKEIDNPYALAWYLKNKGAKSHKNADGTMKKEETELEESNMSDKSSKDSKEKPPFDGPYKKTSSTVTDKSGAVHTPMSIAKHLARQGLKKVTKEEVEQIDEAIDPSEIASNPRMYSADAAKKAYYHKKASDSDKESLARHLDRHHGNKEWRKPVKEEVVDEGVTGAVAGGIMGGMAGGPIGAVAGAYLGHKLQQGANAAKKIVKQKENEKKLRREEVEELEERNKENATKRKMMDASRGARFKAQGNYVPDAEPQHKTAQAHNKAIGRAIRQMSNEEVEQITEGMKTTHEDPLVTVHDKYDGKWELHTHANLSTANHIFGTKVKHTDVHAGPVSAKNREGKDLKFAISKHHAQAVKDEEKFRKQFGEQAPVAPTLDRKYIKGTPEHKAYKATKKPINGHPTNVKEQSGVSYKDFMLMLEYESKDGVYKHKGTYGRNYVDPEGADDADDKQPKKVGRKTGSKVGPKTNLGNSKLHKGK